MTNKENKHSPHFPDASVVLVVEDHVAYCEVVSRALEAYVQGVRCIGAASLAEAFDALGKNPVDVMVIDMTLPDGTALDLLAQASQHLSRGMKVILFSNYSSAEMAPLLGRPDIHAVLTKEQGLRDLARAVREVRLGAEGNGMHRQVEACAA